MQPFRVTTALGPRLCASGPRLCASGPRLCASGPRLCASGPRLCISQTRTLHMTGPATYSNLLTTERPKYNTPRVVSDTETRVPDASGKPARHFNTSRSLKTVGDSSTIDFAYIPDFDPNLPGEQILRVPILPEAEAARKEFTAADGEDAIVIPTIFTAAADGTHIHAPAALVDVTDNGSVDFEGMAARIARTFGGEAGDGEGIVRHVWQGLKEDLFSGAKQSRS